MSSKASAIGAVVAMSAVLIAGGLWGALTQSPTFTTPRQQVAASELEAYKARTEKRRRALGFRLAAWAAIVGTALVVLIAVL